jgi:hypothetical protein
MSDFIPAIELNRRFYYEVVAALVGDVPHAAALLGNGSEVLGFDTVRSTDHGWGPRLQVFVDAKAAAQVAGAVDAGLPDTFAGWPTRYGWDDTPVSSHLYIGPLGPWLREQLGVDPTANDLQNKDWLTIPQQLLLSVTAGAVFHDPPGTLTAVRQRLAWYPDDVWRYVLACQWRRIEQEEAFVGRTAELRDELGGRVVTARLVRDLMRLCFLIERRYAPYSKWLGSAFAHLRIAPVLTPHLVRALADTDCAARDRALAAAYEVVAAAHNDLRLHDPVDPATRTYYSRPYAVLRADRFVSPLRDSIGNPWLRRQPLIGAIDQFVDSTDVLSHANPARLASVYAE